MAEITSTIDFIGPHDALLHGKPYSLKYEPPDDFPRTNFVSVTCEQQIRDIRGREKDFTVQEQGFAVLELDPMMEYEDYHDKQKVDTVYSRQVALGVKDLLGASRVQIFEHVLRKRHAAFPIATGEAYQYDQPTTRAHIDMTPDWACATAEHMNDRKGIPLPSTTFQFVNIWKPLRGPVKDWPLAFCDARSLAPHDMEQMDVVHRATIIETYLVHPNENQKWYYLSDQTEKEAIVFLQADSRVGKHYGVPHTSFRHPRSHESEFPRESIEVRAIVYYDDPATPMAENFSIS